MNDQGNPSRLPAVAKIVVFDIAGPLALYLWLRSQGWSTVTSLVVSGVLPAVDVILGAYGRQARRKGERLGAAAAARAEAPPPVPT